MQQLKASEPSVMYGVTAKSYEELEQQNKEPSANDDDQPVRHYGGKTGVGACQRSRECDRGGRLLRTLSRIPELYNMSNLSP
jgi:hypothetical protein